MIKNSAIGTFNLGSGREISINLIAKILKKINKKLIIIYDLFQNTGIKKSIASIKKIKKITKFKPNISFAKNIKALYKRKVEDAKKYKYLIS